MDVAKEEVNVLYDYIVLRQIVLNDIELFCLIFSVNFFRL